MNRETYDRDDWFYDDYEEDDDDFEESLEILEEEEEELFLKVPQFSVTHADQFLFYQTITDSGKEQFIPRPHTDTKVHAYHEWDEGEIVQQEIEEGKPPLNLLAGNFPRDQMTEQTPRGLDYDIVEELS